MWWSLLVRLDFDNTDHVRTLPSVCDFLLSLPLEREAEKIKERLAQEEAEAMEMEDEENKLENTNNEKEVCEYYTLV